MKNSRKQNFEGEANKVQLDKDTWRSKLNGKCIFNILILLLFISCSIRASSFIENVPQINAKPIAFESEICSGNSHEIDHSFYQSFFSETGLKIPWISREIAIFFREFDPENPAKFDFFFRNLPEALSWVSKYMKDSDSMSWFNFFINFQV